MVCGISADQPKASRIRAPLGGKGTPSLDSFACAQRWVIGCCGLIKALLLRYVNQSKEEP